MKLRKFRHKKTDVVVINGNERYDYYTKIFPDGGVYDNKWALPTIHKSFVEDSNDWEEILETKKDYVILSFIDNTTKMQVGVNHIDIKLENPKGWSIHSVKRLLDGVVFNIGDNISNQDDFIGLITSFEIINNSNQDIAINVKLNRNEDAKLRTWLSNIKHVKKLLFITNDGKEIFEGDKYYSASLQYPVEEHTDWDRFVPSIKRFSTRKLAEEYEIMNKPCLSINDIDINLKNMEPELQHMSYKEFLRKIVKSKLCQ